MENKIWYDKKQGNNKITKQKLTNNIKSKKEPTELNWLHTENGFQ